MMCHNHQYFYRDTIFRKVANQGQRHGYPPPDFNPLLYDHGFIIIIIIIIITITIVIIALEPGFYHKLQKLHCVLAHFYMARS